MTKIGTILVSSKINIIEYLKVLKYLLLVGILGPSDINVLDIQVLMYAAQCFRPNSTASVLTEDVGVGRVVGFRQSSR